MVVCLGPIDLRLGRLAALLGRDDLAIGHLRDTVEITERMGARAYQAEARYALALVLARGGGDGDRELAVAELERALAIARELGMAKLVEDALARKLELPGGAGGGEAGDRTLPLGRKA
jgi:hypothetical protein